MVMVIRGHDRRGMRGRAGVSNARRIRRAVALINALGVQTDRDSISILGLSGIREIPTVARLLVAFGIPTVALVDEDPGNPNTAAATAQITATIGVANVFQHVPNIETVFGLAHKPSRVDAMTTFPAWFAANPVPQVHQDLAARVAAIRI